VAARLHQSARAKNKIESGHPQTARDPGGSCGDDEQNLKNSNFSGRLSAAMGISSPPASTLPPLPALSP